MTEEETKTKWCPHVRYAEDREDRNAANRTDKEGYGDGWDRPMFARCIGSACSQWRWEKRITNRDEMDRAASTFTIATRRLEPIFENTEHGYCGLAGKP